MNPNPYEILGVKEDSSLAEVESSFIELALRGLARVETAGDAEGKRKREMIVLSRAFERVVDRLLAKRGKPEKNL
jgi:preprotein translocase subunit Sec63